MYRSLYLTFALIALFTLPPTQPAAAANACEIRQVGGVLDGICDFARLYGKVSRTFDFRSRQTIHFPNLKPDGMDYFVNGNVVDVAVEVENSNWPDAGPHDVHVALQVMQGGQGVGQPYALVARVNHVPAGGTTTVNLGQITLADRNNDNDLVAMISVDTPVPMQLPRGAVVESDETDNTVTKSCRVYGRINADPSVRPCN